MLQVIAELAKPSHGQQLVPSMATGSVAPMFPMRGRLVGGGGEVVWDTLPGRFSATRIDQANPDGPIRYQFEKGLASAPFDLSAFAGA